MAAHFVRHLAWGAAAWLLTGYILYACLVSVDEASLICSECNVSTMRLLQAEYDARYALDQTWPLNYLTWIATQEDVNVGEFFVPGYVGMSGAYVSKHFVTLVREGHYELEVAPWLLAAIVSLMLIATLQRRGRQPVRSISHAQMRDVWLNQPTMLIRWERS